MTKKITVIICLILLAACGKQIGEVSNMAAKETYDRIDLNTKSPDQTVKTWWKTRDMRIEERFQICKGPDKYKFKSDSYIPSLTDGAALKSLTASNLPCEKEEYKRNIMEVKVESDTRAVVLASIHNISPIPVGAIPDESDMKRRDEGEKYKYILERVSGEWKIIQVEIYLEYSGKWMARYDEKNRPRVHSYTYDAY